MNILYSKVFYAYFPVSLFSEYQNLNGLSDNIISLIDPYIFCLFCLLLIIIAFIILKRKEINSYIKTSQLVSKYNTTLIFTVILFIILFKSVLTYERNSWVTLTPKSIFWGLKADLQELNYDSNHYTFTNGFILTYFFELININTKRTLSIEEQNSIKLFFNNKKTEQIQASNPKNIIFIIIESLMSQAIGYTHNKHLITPTLSTLSKYNFYNNNMTCQINKGMSSDGQFIYFTGLLPHSHRITICDYNKNKYEGLAKRLKEKYTTLYTAMVIPTVKTEWKQDIACKLYGIDHLYSVQTYEKDTKRKDNINAWLNDKQVFEYAKNIINNNKTKHFFLTILTSSMHAPYNKEFKEAKIALNTDKLSKEFRCYLQKINYTDYYLGKFIQYLKAKKLYDNTMIIIASDHSEPMNIKEFKQNRKLPVIITGIDYKKNIATPINQIDLYPTILYLTNTNNNSYNGLGNIFFQNEQNINDLQHISDLIIESDYFNQIQ